jgi:DsbC/DsbD-like thiol-disulfide interchange protein
MKTNWLALLGFTLILAGAAQAPDKVTVDPIRDLTVKLGQTVPVHFTIRIRPGFHVNSHKPITAELIPTEMTFTPPEDLVIAKVKYPVGEEINLPFDPTNKLSVYSGDITVSAVVLPQPKAGAGHYTVHGELKYQACDNNSCYPPKRLPIAFNVRITSGATSTRARPNRSSPHIHN